MADSQSGNDSRGDGTLAGIAPGTAQPATATQPRIDQGTTAATGRATADQGQAALDRAMNPGPRPRDYRP